MDEEESTESITEEIDDKDLTKKMAINYSYPSPSQSDFQRDIYRKREFYYHRYPERPKLTSEKDVKEYRDNICARQFTLQEHQFFLSNFINPDTPYKGILVFHGTGSIGPEK
jgi:hypothetical protein